MRVKLGTIKDARKLLEKENAKHRTKLGDIFNDSTLSESYKNEVADNEKKRHKEKVADISAECVKNLMEIKEYINRPVDVLSTDFSNVLNVIKGLGGLITKEELVPILEKYRGQEKALKILKGICKENGIKTTAFYDYMFSEDADDVTLNRGRSVDDYFDTVIAHMGNDILFCRDMNEIADKLGEDVHFSAPKSEPQKSPFLVEGFF